MQLSDKLTFCLAILILLLALGCIYAATPVIAHTPGSLDTSNNPITSTLSIVFPTTRVYKHIKDEFDMARRFNKIVNPTAFRITLIDGRALDLAKETPNDTDHLRIGRQYFTILDEVGNLDGDARTNDQAMWEYPDGMTGDGSRISLIRIFDDGVPRAGVSIVEAMLNRSVEQMVLVLPEKEVLISSIVGFMPLIQSSQTSMSVIRGMVAKVTLAHH